MSSGPRSMLTATVNVVSSSVLPCSSVAPPDLMHREEAARGLVDVHDAVCAGCVLVREPAQLGEQPVRVGVLLHRAMELFHAPGGLLKAQAHATQESSDPLSTWTDVVSLCVEPVEHQAADREPTEA